MIPETMVLNRNQCIGHIIRKIGYTHLVAKKCALFRKDSTISRKQHDARLQLRNLQEPFLIQGEPDISECY